jgi:hypothetical protein
LEASLLQVYGFDLVAEWGNIGVRRLWVLVEGLPAEAPVWRAESWTRADELAALTVEAIDAGNRAVIAALGHKVRGESIRIPRPSEQRAIESAQPPEGTNRVGLDEAGLRQLAAFFGRTGKAV